MTSVTSVTSVTGTTSATDTDRLPAAEDGALRTILRIDGWSTAAFGAVLLAAAAPLSGPLGLPTAWSVPFGVAMFGGAAALNLIAGYPRIRARHAALVVAGNALSGALLILIAFSGVIGLTAWGVAFLLVGAAVVVTYAALELRALRRARAANALARPVRAGAGPGSRRAR
ncbi:hypothetical protein [Actinomadura sp. 21ATH]|uniref:hypothetical protein n=1 Tax=Actinomadura sp. 21ATH TaxID=1735444 RepID=UPI0035BFD3C4